MRQPCYCSTSHYHLAELLGSQRFLKLCLQTFEYQMIRSYMLTVQCYYSVGRFKARYTFAAPDLSNLDVVLSYVKASDVIMFIWPAERSVTEKDEILLSALLSHGLPSTVHVVPGLGCVNTPKQREAITKSVKKMLEAW